MQGVISDMQTRSLQARGFFCAQPNPMKIRKLLPMTLVVDITVLVVLVAFAWALDPVFADARQLESDYDQVRELALDSQMAEIETLDRIEQQDKLVAWMQSKAVVDRIYHTSMIQSMQRCEQMTGVRCDIGAVPVQLVRAVQMCVNTGVTCEVTVQETP